MRSPEIKFFSSSEPPAERQQPAAPAAPTRIQLDFLARGSSCRLFSPTLRPPPSTSLSPSLSLSFFVFHSLFFSFRFCWIIPAMDVCKRAGVGVCLCICIRSHVYTYIHMYITKVVASNVGSRDGRNTCRYEQLFYSFYIPLILSQPEILHGN